jgi:hypothetical protein
MVAHFTNQLLQVYKSVSDVAIYLRFESEFLDADYLYNAGMRTRTKTRADESAVRAINRHLRRLAHKGAARG